MTDWNDTRGGLVPGQEGGYDAVVLYGHLTEKQRDKLRAQKREQLKRAMKEAGKWGAESERDILHLPFSQLDLLLDWYGTPGLPGPRDVMASAAGKPAQPEALRIQAPGSSPQAPRAGVERRRFIW